MLLSLKGEACLPPENNFILKRKTIDKEWKMCYISVDMQGHQATKGLTPCPCHPAVRRTEAVRRGRLTAR